MVNPNNFATPSAQQQGESLWDGQSEAQKFIDNRNNVNSAVQTSQPTPIPQENGSALNLNGDPIKDNKTNFNNKTPGVRGMINEQSEKVADYMENRNKPKKSYTAKTGKLKKIHLGGVDQDYANHPNVIEHNENAARKNN